MRAVALNVFSTLTVVVIRLVCATNVEIRAQAYAARERDAKLSITFQHALVLKVTQEIPSHSVELWIQNRL